MSNKPGKRNRTQSQPRPKQAAPGEYDDVDVPQLGYEGLLAKGLHPEQAWLQLRDNLVDDPEAVEILRETFKANPQFREESRADWQRRGFDPPWQGLADKG